MNAAEITAYACAHQSWIVHAIAGCGGLVAISSALANFRSRLPPWLVKLLDTIGLNFIQNIAKETPHA